jgi:ATP-binding cassette subfamily B protein
VTIDRLLWPAERLAEALEQLAHAARPESRGQSAPPMPTAVRDGDPAAVDRWLGQAGVALGVEVEPISARYQELTQLLTNGGPALLRTGTDAPRYLVVLRSNGRRVRCLASDLSVHSEHPDTVRSALCAELEQPIKGRIDDLLAITEVPRDRHAKARSALIGESLAGRQLDPGWLLRLPPGAPMWRQLVASRQHVRLAAIVGCHLVQHLLMIAGWALIGRGALTGRLDTGWLLGWGVLLVTLLPFQVAVVHQQGRFLVGASALLKRRLLAGVLQLEPEEVRRHGAGQLLGRVLESEALESLLLGGGYLAALSLVEIVAAAAVLALGAGGGWHVLLLAAWIAVVLMLSLRLYRAREQWTESRLDVTNDLIERMVGHRTRLVQERPERWHDGEDRLLAAYLRTALRLNAVAPLLAMAPKGWMVLGVTGLVAPFVTGQTTTTSLAIALGGILLGSRALHRLSAGVTDLAAAAIAWQRVSRLYHAAARESPQPDTLIGTTNGQRDLLVARDVAYQYPARRRPALESIELELHRGDQVLLLGPSGGGKSTLAALLGGLRINSEGLLLLRGLDRTSLGPRRWRSSVVVAPQLHENHVFTETFAFNLLMGRGWPPAPGDLQDATAVCRELGLDELLERMPSGMQQMVGESGWQLSHGERSRLFLARALLQGAELMILDETLGALDSESLRRAMASVRRHAPTLMVIAHP